jgi:peroxiredoxin
MPRDTRFEEFEQRFTGLANRLEDSPVKEAVSILHAMLLDLRKAGGSQPAATLDSGFEKIANLYKTAPGMEGHSLNSGLTPGTPAPEFTLPDANGTPVSLSNYRGKLVVLVFYPLDWSPACSDQLSLYQADLESFESLGASILAISVDSLYSHGAWTAVRQLSFPLLADFNPKGAVAKQYGVWRETDGFSERAVFVLDPQGVICYSFVSPELPNIPDIYELLENVKKASLKNSARPAGEK